MKYMLDTNICIYLIKQQPSSVEDKFNKLLPGDVGISSITLAELFYGVEKSHYVERNQKALEKFILPLEILEFGDKSSQEYAKIRIFLERKGTPIGPMDLMIAAHAKSLNVVLVTHNEREFRRIPDLKIENWFK